MPQEQDCRKKLKLIYKGSRLAKIELDGVLLKGLTELALTGELVVPTLEELKKTYIVEYEEKDRLGYKEIK